ncbi:FecR domain-containing protein [Methylophilus aquaticus]|uniref:FecR domain-containing protein n=1 Tax=Methylophilus aquaticus TaxID=1971610 RepID=A0ABT9JQR9_9PROT|nr:FecR domain-containing protein [Methylophilus aquaticus]MDP8566912.1 FecR domain-containing protein [Methylophilus aquaticus]
MRPPLTEPLLPVRAALAEKITPAMQQASLWYARWRSDDMDEQAQVAWQAWLEADDAHRQAWQRVESIQQQFGKVPAALAVATLQAPPSAERRRVLKQMVILLSASGVGYYSYREQPWRGVLADAKTSVGERRQIMLTDGTRLHLNTDSAVNILYTDQVRVVELLHGEIMIETAHEQLAIYRPFRVLTKQGSVTALGTRFGVRDWPQAGRALIKVNVFEGEVEVLPSQSTGLPVHVMAGESLVFSQVNTAAKTKLKATDMAWVNGLIVVYAIRLQDFVQELSRYHSGVLRCDPAVAELQISGAFPTQDMEAILQTIAQTLPVRIRRFTRYWTTLVPV